MVRARRNRARRAGKRVARKGNSSKKGGISSDRGQSATIKETVEFVDLNPNLGYNFNFNLYYTNFHFFKKLIKVI